jgi:hypothetical protein
VLGRGQLNNKTEEKMARKTGGEIEIDDMWATIQEGLRRCGETHVLKGI